MQLCYIDESGDTGSFTLDNVNSQPVFLLTALFMPQERTACTLPLHVKLQFEWT